MPRFLRHSIGGGLAAAMLLSVSMSAVFAATSAVALSGCMPTTFTDTMVALQARYPDTVYFVSGNASYAMRCTEAGSTRTTLTAPPGFTFTPATATVGADQRLVVVGTVTQVATGITGIGLVRLDPEGAIDASYGLYGGAFASYATTPHVVTAFALSDGTILVGGDRAGKPLLARFAADGGVDTSFDGTALASVFPQNGSVDSVAPGADGRWLVGVTGTFPLGTLLATRAVVARLMPGGAPDLTFGRDGLAVLDAWPVGTQTQSASLRVLPDGLIALAASYADGSGRRGIALARFTADGAPDTSFGDQGVATTPAAGVQDVELQAQADRRLVVVAGGIVYRFTADGAADPSFGPSGGVKDLLAAGPSFSAMPGSDELLVLAVPVPGSLGYSLLHVSLDDVSPLVSLSASTTIAGQGVPITLAARTTPAAPDGTHVAVHDITTRVRACDALVVAGVATCTYTPLAGQHTLRAFYNGTSDAGPSVSGSLGVDIVVSEPGTQGAIEFHHAAYDHFFVTSSAAEAAALDGGTPSGWRRTGRVFAVWPLATSGKSDVCRFWTGQHFAPTSSHFYTPYPAECAKVKMNADWIFEGEVFALGLTDASGACAAGVPLFRYYNQGQGGAPNHRYAKDAGIRNDMIARGWVPEGNGAAVVFACVPGGAL